MSHEVQPKLGKGFGRPTLIVAVGRLADDKPAPGTQQADAALRNRSWRTESPAHHTVVGMTVLATMGEFCGVSKCEGDPITDIEVANRRVEEVDAAL